MRQAKPSKNIDPYIERSISHQSTINAVQNSLQQFQIHLSHQEAAQFISTLYKEGYSIRINQNGK